MKQKTTTGTTVLKHSTVGMIPLAMFVIVLLHAFALGAYGLDRDTISRDELNSLSIMGAFDQASTPAQITELLRKYSPHHQPLYFIIGWMWALVTDLSHFPMRLLSLLLGMLMLALVYRLATDLVDRRVAIVATLVLSTNVLTVSHFHNIRMYVLVMLLATLHLWCYWQLAHRNGTGRIKWHLFVATCAALLYTHNFTAAFFAGLGIYHLLFVERSSQWLRVLMAWVLGFTLFLPGLQQTLIGISFQAQFPRHRPLLTYELTAAVALELTNHLAVLGFPILYAIGLSVLRKSKGIVSRLAFIGFAMFVVMASIDAVTHFLDWTGMRHFLAMWPVFLICFSAALFSLPWKRVTYPLFVLLWVASGYQLAYTDVILQYPFRFYTNTEYPPLHRYVQHLSGKVRDDDFVLGFRTSDEIYAISSSRGGNFLDYYLGNQLGIDGVFLHSNLRRYRLTEDTRNVLEAHPHILLAHDPIDVPLNYARTLAVVQEVLAPCDLLVDEPTLSIRKYAHPVMGCNHEAAPIEYDNGVRLIDRATKLEPQAQRIQVLTWWDVPDEEMLDQYNISLQIITSDGQNVRQIDRHLYNNIVPWSVIELSTADLSAGDYRLMLILYHRDTGGKVNGVDEIYGESAGILPILSFSIDT